MADDPRWAKLERVRPAILANFADAGVVRVEFVAAWPDLDGVSVWLCTNTDRERDAPGAVDHAKEEIVRILRAGGLDDRDLRPGNLSTTVQSQETADREYRGSWFLAMR